MNKSGLNFIKMDIYNCFKSKVIWILIGVIFIFSVISLYISHETLSGNNININGVSATEIMTEVDRDQADSFFYWCQDIISGDFLLPFIIIFSALTVGRDFSSGFIKSVISRFNRLQYVTGKIVVLMVFIIMANLATFCAVIVSNMVFFKFNSVGEVNSYLKIFLTEFLLCLTIGLIVEFLTFISKKQIFSLSGTMLYYLLFANMLYSIVNKIIKVDGFEIEKYTVFGATKYLVGNISSNVFQHEIFVLLIYLFGAIFLLYMGMIRRDI